MDFLSILWLIKANMKLEGVKFKNLHREHQKLAIMYEKLILENKNKYKEGLCCHSAHFPNQLL